MLGRKFKEIMSKLEGNFIFQSGSTVPDSRTPASLEKLSYSAYTSRMSGCKYLLIKEIGVLS